jgi:hypothetical protein
MRKSHRNGSSGSDAKYSYDYRYIAYGTDDILFLDDLILLQHQNPFLLQCQNPRLSQMIINTNWQQTQLHQSAQYPSSRIKQLTIPFDQCLCFFHFRKQVGITNYPSCISDFTTSLIQPRNDPHNGSFGNISQLDNIGEWLIISSISYQERGREHTIPPAHSYTTSTNPTLYFSLNSS